MGQGCYWQNSANHRAPGHSLEPLAFPTQMVYNTLDKVCPNAHHCAMEVFEK